MRQLNYIKAKTLEWHDVPSPTLGSDEAALVKPLTVSTCDMDGVVIWGLIRFRGPVPVGHECVAEVVDVGDAVEDFSPGDRVIVPWKISCGKCANCVRGFTAHCRSVVREACYGWGPTAREHGGFLADLVHVPWADHMLYALPEGMDPLLASGVSDNVVDAWRAVAPPMESRPGARVLVAGGAGPGSAGLWAAALAVALGADEVTYLDWSESRRRLALGYGVDRVLDTTDGLPELEGDFDVTVDASGNPEALRFAVLHTAANGTCTSTSAAGYLDDVPLPLLHMYRQAITVTSGWVHTRPLMPAPLELIADGRFDPAAAFTAVAPFDEAPDRLVEPFTKLAFVA